MGTIKIMSDMIKVLRSVSVYFLVQSKLIEFKFVLKLGFDFLFKFIL